MGSFYFLASTALAHGGPPAALGIVAADTDGRPSMVLLDEGLAMRQDDSWSFVCPTVWGNRDTDSDKAPLARSIDGHASWIIGADDLYLAQDGAWLPQQRPELGAAAVVDLAADETALYALRLDGTGSAVIRLDHEDKPVLYESEVTWSALAADPDTGRIYLARATNAPALVVLALDREGQPIEEQQAMLQTVPERIKLRSTSQGLFATLLDDGLYTLAAIEPSGPRTLVQSIVPIAGPQLGPDGTLLIAVDGELQRQVGDGFESTGETREVTCLRPWGSTAYACSSTDLHRLTNSGLGERVFTIDGIAPTPPALIPAGGERDCEFQWLLYKADLERIGLTPGNAVDAATSEQEIDAGTSPEPPDDPAVAPTMSGRPSSGCSLALVSARGSQRWLAGMLCVAWLLWTRRALERTPLAATARRRHSLLRRDSCASDRSHDHRTPS